MANLRDRGYGNSMEGYQPKLQLKKADERHSRKKTVAPGEATVSKGQKVANTPVQTSSYARLPSPEEIRSMPPYGSVPEYGPVGLPSSDLPYLPNTPISLHYSDPLDQLDHQIDVEIPATTQRVAQSMKDKYSNTSGMSLDEIKKRMEELDYVLNNAYTGQQIARAKRAATRKVTDFYYSGIPMQPSEKVANYYWDMHDYLNDWMPDVTDDPVALALEQQAHAKAAAAGHAIEAQAYPQNQAVLAGYDAANARNDMDIQKNEAALDQLFFEYNNLKNEYNVRLAQYLQGLR